MRFRRSATTESNRAALEDARDAYYDQNLRIIGRSVMALVILVTVIGSYLIAGT